MPSATCSVIAIYEQWNINELTKKMRVVLIGGSSHVGKSTLSRLLAAKLDCSCLATDSLARHPGRPWLTKNNQVIKENVVGHYRTLSVEDLLTDVLCHYQTNVIPQIETIANYHRLERSTDCIIIEGSALWPGFVTNLVDHNSIQGIWLTASDRCFATRIFSESNFYRVDEGKQYLIQKFLDRTLLYNRRIQEEVKRLGLISINVESTATVEKLADRCIKLIDL